MKTTSILESIRNKMKKIEDNDVAPQNTDDSDHDDFDYIDDVSKNIINSKHSSFSNRRTEEDQSNTFGSEDDLDFLSDDDEIETRKSNNNLSTKKPISFKEHEEDNHINDHHDYHFDIDEDHEEDHDEDHEEDHLDLDLKNQPVSNKNSNSRKFTLDELGLGDIDVDDDLKTTKTPQIKEDHDNTLDDDLDLEEIFEEDDDHAKTVDIPKISEISKTPEQPKTVEKVTNKDEKYFLPTSSVTSESQDDNIFKDEDLYESKNEAPVSTQVNYQKSDKSHMENLAKSTIISEEIAKQTSSAIKDIIKSVPKPSQNQQVLSSPSPAFRSGETIEEMVAAILAPKLEQWIHENLPPMVEKIVKKEIKRLIPEDHE